MTADPVALIGLTPVLGFASTVLRSDSAPALNQAITPIWVGAHRFTQQATFAPGGSGQDPAWPADPSSPNTSTADTNIATPVLRVPGVTFGPTVGLGQIGVSGAGETLSVIIASRTVFIVNRSFTMRAVNNNVSINVANEVPGQVGVVGAFRFQAYSLTTILGIADNGAGKVRLTTSGGSSEFNENDENRNIIDITGVIGVPGVNGHHIAVAVVDDTHVDLPALAFSGAYVSGGWIAHFVTPGQIQGRLNNGIAGQITGDFRIQTKYLGIANDTITIGYPLITINTGVVLKVQSGGTAAAPGFVIGGGAIPSGIYSTSAAQLGISTNGLPRLNVTNTGQIIASNTIEAPLTAAKFEISTTLVPINVINFNNATAGGATMSLAHSRGAPLAGPPASFSHSVLLSGDTLYGIDFCGDDGVNYFAPGARLVAQVDGTASAGVMPGRLLLSAADAAGAMREVIRYTGVGLVSINRTGNNASNALADEVMRINAPIDGTIPRILVNAFGAAGALSFRHAGGASATKTGTLSGTVIGLVEGRGYTGSNYGNSGRASVAFSANENFSASAQGADVVISSTPSGGTILAESLRLRGALAMFGGTTSAFPALKQSGAVLQARLADDSNFAPLQGRLTTHANATNGTIVPNKLLTIYDAAGTAYLVPAVQDGDMFT